MRTVETSLETHPGWWGRARRDVRLIVRLARMTLDYATAGRRIRRSYRRAQDSGTVYWVDDPEEAERTP